jgi:TatD DNase family protein
MIDTHCHIDLYTNPLKILNDCEKEGIITIGMTNLPSHFEMGYPHVQPFRMVRLALGMHPLYAEHHENQFNSFLLNLSKTSYIGEIGLDFSREGLSTKEIQLSSFRKILKEVSGMDKLLSIHSRRAEKEVLNLLVENGIQNAIFHWFSGPPNMIQEIANLGYYFSVNTAMIQSSAGREIIQRIPKSRILPESDGPFIQVKKRTVEPRDTFLIYQYLSNLWDIQLDETEKIVLQNFRKLTSGLIAVKLG